MVMGRVWIGELSIASFLGPSSDIPVQFISRESLISVVPEKLEPARVRIASHSQGLIKGHETAPEGLGSNSWL